MGGSKWWTSWVKPGMVFWYWWSSRGEGGFGREGGFDPRLTLVFIINGVLGLFHWAREKDGPRNRNEGSGLG